MKRKFILITASVIVVIGMCAALLAMQAAQGAERQESSKSSPNTTRLLIDTRNDAPVDLQIVNPESAGVDPYATEVEVRITNTSNKTVSAYAIKDEVSIEGKVWPSGIAFGRFLRAQSALRPGDSQTVEIGRGSRHSAPVELLIVFVDFLEFTDGTTWGADTSSSRDVLAGLRAGEDATAKYLRWLLAA